MKKRRRKIHLGNVCETQMKRCQIIIANISKMYIKRRIKKRTRERTFMRK
jgi:hypothetical protein